MYLSTSLVLLALTAVTSETAHERQQRAAQSGRHRAFAQVVQRQPSVITKKDINNQGSTMTLPATASPYVKEIEEIISLVEDGGDDEGDLQKIAEIISFVEDCDEEIVDIEDNTEDCEDEDGEKQGEHTLIVKNGASIMLKYLPEGLGVSPTSGGVENYSSKMLDLPKSPDVGKTSPTAKVILHATAITANATQKATSKGKNATTSKATHITKTTKTVPNSPSAPANSANSTDGPSGEISDILVAHNEARASHGARPLAWNDTLTALAKTWAEGCVFGHGGTTVASHAGQNLAAEGGAIITGQYAVNEWMGEEKNYDPANPSGSHFTQVVWKASTQLGCFQASCNSTFVDGWGKAVWPSSYLPAYYIVCNYSPQGNISPLYAENVQKKT